MIDYNKLHISEQNKQREQDVIQQIGLCITDGKSWVFDAGAGSGKTYALIQSLELVINRFGTVFSAHRQKIICITYTNSAANEIKDRLKNSPHVRVSTIHERLWDIIAPYHRELLHLHRKKLLAALTDKEKSLVSKSWAQAYQSLTPTQKSDFQTYILKVECRNRFYSVQSQHAAAIRTAFPDIVASYPTIIKNVGNFKQLVQCLYSVADYSKALLRTQKKNCPHVVYDPRLNTDRLTKMRISHDTLLEYSYSIISNNDCLKQIVCDQYPVVFVDEYQDTHPLVIKTLACVARYAKKIQHPFIVGYYGDTRQNIYDTGIGYNLFRTHPGLVRIKKVFNRRSSPKVINVANLIRNDGLIQESIYTSFPESDVRCYVCSNAEHDSIIDQLCQHWSISNDSPLHCFELTNELVAKESGFECIYMFFKNSRYYKQARRFELLKDHVLSQDNTKLNDVALLVYHLLDFYKKVQDDKTALSEIISLSHSNAETRSQINITNLRNLTQKLRTITGNTLEEYVLRLFEHYNTGDVLFDECINQIVSGDIESPDQLVSYIQAQLFPDSQGLPLPEDELAKDRLAVQSFLQIDIETFYRWHDFLVGNESNSKVIFHTYHSTKGREFDNVLIFMTAKFGSDCCFFSNLLSAFTANTPASNDTAKIGAARNLFYVAVTRAVKNLCVVYLVDDEDDISAITTSLEKVFPNVILNGVQP